MVTAYSPPECKGLGVAVVNTFTAIPAIGGLAFSKSRSQSHWTYFAAETAVDAVFRDDSNTKLSFLADTAEQATEWAETAAETPPGQQFQKDNNNKKHSFHS